jgi:hypothetical protein
MGQGDEHENRFTKFERTENIGDLVAQLSLSETSRYLGVRLQYDLCPYSILLYPSEEYEANLTSRNPIYFSVAVLLIFVFVTAVFIVYGKYRYYCYCYLDPVVELESYVIDN